MISPESRARFVGDLASVLEDLITEANGVSPQSVDLILQLVGEALASVIGNRQDAAEVLAEALSSNPQSIKSIETLQKLLDQDRKQP